MSDRPRILVVVGAGGVGKTTIAAALGVLSARTGADTLVMTFDPSLRLKDALGVGDEARRRDVEVKLDSSGSLHASLLDARDTFDRLVERYAPDERARDRILANRFYDHLSGTLGGVLEYMAVERLFEVAAAGRYERVILDTPPTRQALDFLEAPQRIVSFLDSGALRIALRPWFDEDGHLRPTRRLGFVGRNVEAFLDRIVGLEVLRDMAEFFQRLRAAVRGVPRARHRGAVAAAVAAHGLRSGQRSRRGAGTGHAVLRPAAGRGGPSPRAGDRQPRPPAGRRLTRDRSQIAMPACACSPGSATAIGAAPPLCDRCWAPAGGSSRSRFRSASRPTSRASTRSPARWRPAASTRSLRACEGTLHKL